MVSAAITAFDARVAGKRYREQSEGDRMQTSADGAHTDESKDESQVHHVEVCARVKQSM